MKDKDLDMEIPKDKTEALWFKVKGSCEDIIAKLEDDLVVNKEILKLAESKLK